jgi:hypothetical protein
MAHADIFPSDPLNLPIDACHQVILLPRPGFLYLYLFFEEKVLEIESTVAKW